MPPRLPNVNPRPGSFVFNLEAEIDLVMVAAHEHVHIRAFKKVLEQLPASGDMTVSRPCIPNNTFMLDSVKKYPLRRTLRSKGAVTTTQSSAWCIIFHKFGQLSAHALTLRHRRVFAANDEHTVSQNSIILHSKSYSKLRRAYTARAAYHSPDVVSAPQGTEFTIRVLYFSQH